MTKEGGELKVCLYLILALPHPTPNCPLQVTHTPTHDRGKSRLWQSPASHHGQLALEYIRYVQRQRRASSSNGFDEHIVEVAF
jgi:hypothetical protein